MAVVLLPRRGAALGELRPFAAETQASPDDITFEFPNPIINSRGRVTALEGTFAVRGRITIQTVYGPQARPSSRAAYGVGTREADERDHQNTLQDHENGHIRDFTNNLQHRRLPAFTGHVGMTEAQYSRACTRYQEALQRLVQAMMDRSRRRTDEVGYRRSQFEQFGPRPDPGPATTAPTQP